MKMRFAALLSGVSLVVTGCGGGFFVARERNDAVKKVAVVQYAINPHILLGPAAIADSKLNVAAKNVETFGKELGNTYQVVPAAEVLGNPAYASAGGKPQWDGYYSGKGMHYFSTDEQALIQATIAPEVAAKLCEVLGVDAIVAIYDSWAISQFAMNFKGHTRPEYSINMFDKTGARVWGGKVRGESETDFDTPNDVIATDVDVWTKANGESFAVALGQVKTSIGAK